MELSTFEKAFPVKPSELKSSTVMDPFPHGDEKHTYVA